MERNTVKIGTLIAKRYEIIAKLGEGGMGTVYTCKNKDLGDRLFAIKILNPQILKDENNIKRFRNEINAAYDVSHKNVVRAYEYIKDGDIVAYTMEYVEGGDLMDLMSSLDLLTVEQILRYFYEICLGVGALHNHGIIHRDIKPENILITKDQQVKISDFGISIIDRNTRLSRITEHGGLVGSVNYLAPEYMTDSQIDSRVDIYAMGIIIYELLTGEDPFESDNIYTKMQLKMDTEPTSPKEYRHDCPNELVSIVMKCMARDPKNRYDTCDDIITDLVVLPQFPEDLIPKHSRAVKVDRKTKLTDKEFKIEIKESEKNEESEIVFEDFQKVEGVDSDSLRAKVESEAISKPTTILSTAIATPAKKKTKLPAIISSIIVICILVGGYMAMSSKKESNSSPVKYVEGDEFALLENEIENIPESLPKLFSFSQEVNGMNISSDLSFKDQRLDSIDLNIDFPESKSSLYLKAMKLKSLSVKHEGNNFYNAIAQADVTIIENGEEVVTAITAKIAGSVYRDTGLITVAFQVPQGLDVKKAKNSFYIRKYKGKYIYYAHGNFSKIVKEK